MSNKIIYWDAYKIFVINVTIDMVPTFVRSVIISACDTDLSDVSPTFDINITIDL